MTKFHDHPCGGEGRTRTFEAARATDLQSAAFDRFATSPSSLSVWNPCFRRVPCKRSRLGAGEGIRTPDLLITNQLLYRPELRQPKQKWNYSTSYATQPIPVLPMFPAILPRRPYLSRSGQPELNCSASLTDRFEQRDSGGDRHVQTLDVAAHRNGGQPVAALPHQASKATPLGAHDERGRQC